jgi:hypothetical protein
MTKDIEVTPVESQVLPFHLGPGRIIENQHTFIHFIDTNSLSELLDDTINQFKTINNTFNSTTPSKTNIYKNTLENLLTHTNHIITEAKIKLINIKPNTRNKRGLLDIIGKTSKFFYLGLWTPMGGGGGSATDVGVLVDEGGVPPSAVGDYGDSFGGAVSREVAGRFRQRRDLSVDGG